MKGKQYIHEEESFLVECRTIPGTSGSPVFLTHAAFDDSVIVKELLGIVWGYMYYNPKVYGEFDWDTNLNTGMAGVVPAWKLAEFLSRDDLAMTRKQIEEQAMKEAKKRPSSGASPAGVMPNDDREFTEQDFEEALEKVSRRKKPKEDKGKQKKGKKAG